MQRKPLTSKQIAAARQNGARSLGPITAQGKRRSSANSARHNLLASTVVLEEEATSRFHTLLAGYLDEYQPTTATQLSLIETMAAARWRQLRVWGLQKTALDRDMAFQDPNVGPAPVRALLAHTDTGTRFDLLVRYDTAFDRQFSRAHARLLLLKSQEDPQAAPYFPENPTGHTFEAPITKRTPEVFETKEAEIETVASSLVA